MQLVIEKVGKRYGTGSGKLFEALYLALWYLGPMNRVPLFDFAATSQATVESGAWVGFALLGLVLYGAAMVRRR